MLLFAPRKTTKGLTLKLTELDLKIEVNYENN